MVQGYYTLEEASRILEMSQEKLSQMAQRREVRAFADRGTWRFRTQDIDEMARRMGRGSSPELQLGEAVKPAKPASPSPRSPRPAESPGPKQEQPSIFDFEVASGEPSAPPAHDIVVDSPSKRKLTGKSSSRISPSPKPGSDSDVKLVPDGSDVDFRIAPDSDVRLEQPPRPGGKPSSKKLRPPVEEPKSSSRRKTGISPGPSADAGVRLVPQDTGAPPAPPKTPADSDIRFEEYRGPSPSSHQRGDHSVTEEIDLDAELRKADEIARAQKGRRIKPKTAMPEAPPTSSDFELSLEGRQNQDKTSEFPAPSDEQVELGELPPRDLTAGGDSGINLGAPADSGIDLENVGAAEKVEFELGLEDVPAAPAAEQPAAPKAEGEEEDSSSEFELSLDVEGTPPPADAKDDSSSEFELSLDVEGTPPPAKADDDSSSEFELTLDGTEGLAPVEEGSSEVEPEKDIFETDFEVPAMNEGAPSDAADLEESDTALESSDFDLSLVGESASQVVDLGDESADESSDTISRSVVLDEDAVDDVDELLEDDLGALPAPVEVEEEEEEGIAVAAAPASWGIVPTIFLIPCVLVMFFICMMSFEMLHSLLGFGPSSRPSGALVKWVARTFGEKVPD